MKTQHYILQASGKISEADLTTLIERCIELSQMIGSLASAIRKQHLA